MKKLLVAVLGALLLPAPVAAEDIKLGVILGFTGPIESLTPDMASAAEMAIKEVNEAGGILGGSTVLAVRADSTCTDAAAASAAAERLITSDHVNAIIGADCSGVTTAILKNVAMARGVVMISPSATSPALSTVADDGLFFRTSPSDARQGAILAAILKEKGVTRAALTYTNNDYGKGLAESIKANFEKMGGKITLSAAHEDGKGDYNAEIGALAAAGGDVLIVAGYLDQGGKGIIQAALDTGAFSTFALGDGMIGDSLPTAIGSDLNGSYGTVPGTDSPGGAKLKEMITKMGFKAGPYTSESYDAAALIMLAMQAAGSSDSAKLKAKVMSVANQPGEKIYPGELAKAIKILVGGGAVDYVGASAVELIGGGESAGSYREILVKGGQNTTVRIR